MTRNDRVGLALMALLTTAGIGLCALGRHLWNFPPKEGDTNA